MSINFRYARVVGLLLGCATMPCAIVSAQSATATLPERAIRRDIPMTNAIKRAFAAGARDSTGRPGRNYWQLRTDYQINVSLEPSTQRLTGSARITIHNNSPDALSEIGLRLDPNHFLGNAPHAAPWVPAEVTDGMVISRLVVNGNSANLGSGGPLGDGSTGARAATAAAGAANAQRTTQVTLQNPKSTVARVRLPTPIAARSSAVLEIDWSHKLPGGRVPGTA